MLEFLKSSQNLSKEGTKHKKNYIEGLNLKNIKGVGSP